MLKEFKEFAVRGSVIDMAVGIIIGAAFTAVIQSLVKDIMMPVLGLMTRGVDFANDFIILLEGSVPPPYPTVEAAGEAGAIVLRYGAFLNSLISFLIVSFAVFLMVRYINRLKRPKKAADPVVPNLKKCPYCISDIAVDAVRCPHCTSRLDEERS